MRPEGSSDGKRVKIRAEATAQLNWDAIAFVRRSEPVLPFREMIITVPSSPCKVAFVHLILKYRLPLLASHQTPHYWTHLNYKIKCPSLQCSDSASDRSGWHRCSGCRALCRVATINGKLADNNQSDHFGSTMRAKVTHALCVHFSPWPLATTILVCMFVTGPKRAGLLSASLSICVAHPRE